MEKVEQDINILRDSFKSGLTKNLSWRREQLSNMLSMIETNTDIIYEALHKDLLRPKYEAVCEVLAIVEEVKYALSSLASWTSPKKISPGLMHYFDSLSTQAEPYGVVLIISPFNYPFLLSLKPLIGAIAAGNCCVVKPSEISPFSGKVLIDLISSHLDNRCVKAVMGDALFGQQLLGVRFDYIFYTGGTAVGKAVYASAASHLTPVTLELGGKSPVYVDDKSSIPLVAKRILWGKLTNCGQVCVSPDYVLCHSSRINALVDQLKSVFESSIPKENDFASSGRIVNERHFNRVCGLLKDSSAHVVYGGQSDPESLRIAFTIILNPPVDSLIMKEEIFGPLLPILSVDSPQEAIDFISVRDKPLALYVFSDSESVVSDFKHMTSSGSLVVNDCLMQLTAKELPFGGVGLSGIGKQFGKSSFDTFSHNKSVYQSGTLLNYFENAYRYFPYNNNKIENVKSLYDLVTGKRLLPPLSFFKKC